MTSSANDDRTTAEAVHFVQYTTRGDGHIMYREREMPEEREAEQR